MTRDTHTEHRATSVAEPDDAEPASAERSARGLRPRRHRLRRLLARLALLVLSTFVGLLLGEVAVRVCKPQVLFPRYVTDSDFGIRVNVPNARYWHTSPEVQIEFRINSMGIRSDREYTFEKPPGMIRIVGLGDSFTQGYEVDLHETYLYRLEQMLTARGHPVEVINLGVSGYGNAEQLIMLEEFGLRFDPDVVIVGYYQNDLHDNLRSDLYRLDEENRLVRAAAAYLPAIGVRNRLYSFRAYRWLAENSQLLSFVREGVARVVKRKMVESKAAPPAATDDDPYPARLASALLDEIKQACAKRNIAFRLLDIPDHVLAESNLPQRLLQSVTHEEIVRTAPQLRAEGPGAYLYRRQGHRHWTPRGHQIAAELLTDALLPLLEASSVKPMPPPAS